MERLRTNEEIARQYMRVSLTLDLLFREAELRSEIGEWKKDGVGTCFGVSKIASETGLEGSAKEIILLLREKVNIQAPGQSRFTACPYHRDDSGCTIPALKASICTSMVDNPKAWKKRFAIDGYQLSADIFCILYLVLNGSEEKLKKYIPENTPTIDEFYELAVDAISQMTDHIRQYPIAYLPL